jgi:Glycosyl hydrolase family 92
MRRVRGVIVGLCRMIMLLLSNSLAERKTLPTVLVRPLFGLGGLMGDVFFDDRFANVGNEPGLLQAALYHYAGAPAKSAARTKKLLGPVFNTNFEGLPGNDDAGTASANFQS